MRIRELAGSRVRYGYRRLTVLLRREGWVVNTKRVYRLYHEEGLQVRTKKRSKRAAHARVPLPEAARPNQRWSMDFVASDSDQCDTVGMSAASKIVDGENTSSTAGTVMTSQRWVFRLGGLSVWELTKRVLKETRGDDVSREFRVTVVLFSSRILSADDLRLLVCRKCARPAI
jgi:hypothetical protein